MTLLIAVDMGLGNAVLLSAFIHTLLMVYPNTRITLLGKKGSVAMALYEPDERVRILYQLDETVYDLCFLPFLGYHTRLLEQIIRGQKAKKIISHRLHSPTFYKRMLKNIYMLFNQLRGVTYVPVCLDHHEIDIYHQLLTPLGIGHTQWQSSPFIPEPVLQKAQETLQKNPLAQDFWVAHCGASNQALTPKSWPTTYWQQWVQQMLQDTDVDVVFVGSSGEADAIQALIDSLPESSQRRCINLAGKLSILELMGVLKKSRWCVGADSGVGHLSAALGVRTVSIWGPSPWTRCHPVGAQVRYVSSNKACSPCIGLFAQTDAQAYKRCAYSHACMMDLKPELVFQEIQKWLKE